MDQPTIIITPEGAVVVQDGQRNALTLVVWADGERVFLPYTGPYPPTREQWEDGLYR